MVRTWLLLTGFCIVLAGCARTTTTTPYRVQLAPAPAPVARTTPPADAGLSLAPETPGQATSPTSQALREQPPLPRGPTLEQPPLAPLEALALGQGSFLLSQPAGQEPGSAFPLGSAQTESVHRLDTDSTEPQPADTLQYGEKVPLVMPARPPNEIAFGKIKFSGILIEFAKTPHPLQLLNPFASGDFDPEDNVVRDSKGNVSGLKAFSVGY